MTSLNIITMDEVEKNLRKVKLKGFKEFLIYKNSNICLKSMDISALSPCQNYVLSDTVQDILNIELQLRTWDNIFPFSFYIPTKEGGIRPYLPPIIERQEIDAVTYDIVMDGMHRLYAATLKGFTHIMCIYITNVPFPYYAYPLENRWKDVEMLDVLSEGYEKKRYVDPNNYKSLFRMINDQFPGIQLKR